MRLWGFDKNIQRKNVTPEGVKFVYSDTIGLVENKGTHKVVLSGTLREDMAQRRRRGGAEEGKETGKGRRRGGSAYGIPRHSLRSYISLGGPG